MNRLCPRCFAVDALRRARANLELGGDPERAYARAFGVAEMALEFLVEPIAPAGLPWTSLCEQEHKP